MDASIVRRPPFGSNPLVGERGTDTQRRILGAALEVFATHGFAETRVELITEKAGCSRPAFYQYFSGKDDVFFTLAGQLAEAMVEQATRLERVTPDLDGLARLTAWLDEFLALHEAWAPVFASFQAATREHESATRNSSGTADRTGLALLRAFGVGESARNQRLATNLLAVLLRIGFYVEQTPSGMTKQPLVDGVTHFLHRVFEGPIEDVNVVRAPAARRRRITVALPDPVADDRPLRPRGEKTRIRLLEAGAKVLPARGYHDARVDDIVATAGVSHGTFYRYFANKDDFFRVLAEGAATRMIELIDRLDLDAGADGLRTWLQDWMAAYVVDGGVISTWQEMQTNEELGAFSQQVAASVFTRLVRLLDRRDFGDPTVDAVTFLAIIERVPYSVHTLGFTSQDEAIESMVTLLRRGLLALPD